MLKINLNKMLKRQFNLYKQEYKEAALRVLQTGHYILDEEVDSFEKEFAKYIGVNYCVTVNSGLDALTLSLKALNIQKNDEIIVPANTFIATILAVINNNATPVFVEPDNSYNINTDILENFITSKTKAIIPVHLYGYPANLEKILKIANNYNIYVIEDCAQSHGAKYKNKLTGNFGTTGCFSFYPTKNCGSFGDGGCITTNDKSITDYLKMLRNYGSNEKYKFSIIGINSRLDEIQAAILRIKLKHLDKLNEERRLVANKYIKYIHNDKLILPNINKDRQHVFHQFVIRTNERNRFKTFLEQNGIETLIHYPIPPHLQKCFKYLNFKQGDFPITEKFANEVLSLPLFNGMTEKEIDYVIHICNKYK